MVKRLAATGQKASTKGPEFQRDWVFLPIPMVGKLKDGAGGRVRLGGGAPAPGGDVNPAQAALPSA
ncbi:MAG: hypothetical protein HXY19_06095 [Thermoanaerobaculaceae bacterium]|nr:hypothetical protein [Thermoanaerobaculaceae bacterium]